MRSPKGRVVILDNDPGVSEVPDRCELVIGDQADRELLDRVGRQVRRLRCCR